MGIADNILDAVSILMDKKVSDLQFNKTVRAKISEVIDTSIGKYKVQYQNSYFTAYASDSNVRYQRGAEVYVEVLSNDFEKNALIIGTVQKLGSNYIAIIDKLDRYTEVGAQLNYNDTVELCSYIKEKEIQLYPTATSDYTRWNLDNNSIMQAAQLADALKIGITIKNNLPTEQRSSGNFGIKIIVSYYDPAFIEQSAENTIKRLYQFDINDMAGEPYKYIVPTQQYGIFNIDKENFKSIESISIFNKDFPVQKNGEPTDIWFSDIHLQFLSKISENELQTSSLRITTPQGNFFTASNQTKELKADLRIKGKRVNYNTQNIDFYWFRENVNITASSEKFSPYGGNGWELLNSISLNTYKIDINATQCLSANTRFRCVAVFTDNGTKISLNTIYIFKNIINSIPEFTISSSAGTSFSFSTGQTILTINGGASTDKYQWARSVGGEALELISGATKKEYTVEVIPPAAEYSIYKCSVFTKAGSLQGTAEIVLYNNKEQNGCTLVLKDSIQIFKYDGYGVSPASKAMAAADRMIIPALSFDIYDKQGNLINIPDAEKSKYMTIKWIWPAEYIAGNNQAKYQTMLVPDTELFTISHIDLTSGKSIVNYGVQGNYPTFTYKIRDTYNAELANTDSARNNIILEVDYQGEHLVARTNFTFTKEGELGTNGTKYIARIIPAQGFNDIFIRSNTLRGIKYTPSGATFIQICGISDVSISNAFVAQLWDGHHVVSGTSVQWSMAKTSTRQGIPRLTITGNNVKINKDGTLNSNIVQATITYQGIKYYATYPIMYTTATSDSFPYIQNGYREVMYESDGSRGKFNGLPFKAAWLNTNGIGFPSGSVAWDRSSSSFGTAVKVANTDYDYTIEPPSYFIGETAGHWVSLKNQNITTYLPIELYLNRYGMNAMNDWDGNSIQVDKNGSKYILAPQIGAGRKENDNSFTGITIGEVFQNINNKEIGMFGYYKGQRSLFLDAETGDAEFGISGKGQIKVHASDGEGTIDSGDYVYRHSTSNPGTGLKIKFTSTGTGTEKGPYIRYGSGNFEVDSEGKITARGGGNIAGWLIDDNNLYSSNEKIYLNSSTPKIYGQTDKDKKHDSLTSRNSGFYLASDGLSLGSNFKATSSGVVYIGDNASAGGSGKKYWEINGSTSNNGVSNSYIRYGNRNAANSVNIATNEITLGTKFYVSDTGVVRVGYNAVTGGTTNKYWTIDASGTNSYIKYGTRNTKNSVNIATNEITLGTKFYVNDEGVVRIGYNAVSGGTNKHWIIDADANGNESYIKYGTFGKTNSVYLGTNKLAIGSKFYVDAVNEFVRIGTGAVDNSNASHWTIDANNTRSYISYKSTSGVPSISSKDINLNGTSTSVYLGTDGIRLGTKFGVDNNGNVKMDNLYASGSGEIGGWKIGKNKLSSQDGKTALYADDSTQLDISTLVKKPIRLSIGDNYDFKILSDGTLAGPPAPIPTQGESYFTPSHTKWEITPGGVAYFTDIKIKNKTGADNIFEWTGTDGYGNPQNIFKLTDTGSLIGGWSISGDRLSSGNINITSGVSGSSTNTVMSVGDVFRLYGNGDLNVQNISSGGSGNFSGSLNASGTGNIGGCTFGGGSFNCPSGVLQFGGTTVTLNTLGLVTSLYPSITVDVGKASCEYTPAGTITASYSGSASGQISLSVSGQTSDGKSISGTASGYVSLPCSGSITATFTGTKATATSTDNFVKKLNTVQVKYTTHTVKALSTGDEGGTEHTGYNQGGSEQ